MAPQSRRRRLLLRRPALFGRATVRWTLAVGLAVMAGSASTPARIPQAAAQQLEDLMATWQQICNGEARRAAAKESAHAALALGEKCADLSKRIQAGGADAGTGADASPLARPDTRVYPDDPASHR